MARRFIDCCEMFEHHFIVRGHDVTRHARHYLSGLLGTQRRKNIYRIEADVVASDYQGMQQFLSDSPWDHEAVMRQVAEEAESTRGRTPDTALYVDESSFVKKGNESVGVQRQYCGRLGKLRNGPEDLRLYLLPFKPSFASDASRRRSVKPEVFCEPVASGCGEFMDPESPRTAIAWGT
ncbi:MAG: transposase [Verrucomicrobia bacterium]|nr:transposase [Verrucomicrobiota bacterium]